MPKQYSDKVWGEVEELHAGGAAVPDILNGMSLKGWPDHDIPSERQVYRHIEKLDAAYTEDQRALDRPWQLRVEPPAGINNEDIPLLMKIVRMSHDLPLVDRLTIRTARWISTLRPFVPEWRALHIWGLARRYSSRERLGVMKGLEKFDTADLDAYIAYTPWASDQKLRAYLVAVKGRVVRVFDDFNEGYPGGNLGFSPGPIYINHPVEYEAFIDPNLKERFLRIFPPPTEYEEEFYARRAALSMNPETLSWSPEQMLEAMEVINRELSAAFLAEAIAKRDEHEAKIAKLPPEYRRAIENVRQDISRLRRRNRK